MVRVLKFEFYYIHLNSVRIRWYACIRPSVVFYWNLFSLNLFNSDIAYAIWLPDWLALQCNNNKRTSDRFKLLQLPLSTRTFSRSKPCQFCTLSPSLCHSNVPTCYVLSFDWRQFNAVQWSSMSLIIFGWHDANDMCEKKVAAKNGGRLRDQANRQNKCGSDLIHLLPFSFLIRFLFIYFLYATFPKTIWTQPTSVIFL